MSTIDTRPTRTSSYHERINDARNMNGRGSASGDGITHHDFRIAVNNFKVEVLNREPITVRDRGYFRTAAKVTLLEASGAATQQERLEAYLVLAAQGADDETILATQTQSTLLQLDSYSIGLKPGDSLEVEFKGLCSKWLGTHGKFRLLHIVVENLSENIDGRLLPKDDDILLTYEPRQYRNGRFEPGG